MRKESNPTALTVNEKKNNTTVAKENNMKPATVVTSKEINTATSRSSITSKKVSVRKRHVFVDYRSCPSEVLEILQQKYPYGFTKDLIKFQNTKGDTISGVRVELDDIVYLVKVNVRLKEMVQDYDLDDDDDDIEKDENDLMKDAAFEDTGDDDDDDMPKRKRGRKGDDDDDDDDGGGDGDDDY